MTARYALYYAPAADHPLWRLGCSWLGRDAEASVDAESIAHDIDDFDRLTEAPRRYGFHATLKAPFALTPGISATDLNAAVGRYARRQPSFLLPPFHVGMLDDFLALVPSTSNAQLQQLESEVVTQFDAFRARVGESELERRGAGLDTGGQALLRRWGYPHVLDRFRFHMTLSGSLTDVSEDVRDRLAAAARRHFAPGLSIPLWIDSLCVFEESEPGGLFRLAHRHAFDQ